MTAENVEELESLLRRHLGLLEFYLGIENVRETDLYMPIAGQLRVLLCDSDVPVLLAAAKEKNVDLYVYGPRQLPPDLRQGLAFSINLQVASWHPPDRPSQLFTISDYLDAEIGAEIVMSGADAVGYTPRQVIKWLSNKDGVCHLDFKKPKSFQALKKWKWHSSGNEFSDGVIQTQILSMAEWTVHAIREVLDPQVDMTLAFRLKLLDQPSSDIPFYVAKSTLVKMRFTCSLNSDHVLLEIEENEALLTDIQIPIPTPWKRETEYFVAVVYLGTEKRLSIYMNDELVISKMPIDLGSLIGQRSRAKLLPGYGQFMNGFMWLYSRALSVVELGLLRQTR